MKEKYSWSAGCPVPNRVKICHVTSSAARNACLDVSVLMVNFLMMRTGVSQYRSVLATTKSKSLNLEIASALETVKRGMTFMKMHM